MIFSLIVAVAENGVIGKDNQLPWHLPDELKYFKQTTRGHCLLLGRRVFESFGGVLPHRTHLVLTHNPYYHAPGAVVMHSVREAMDYARQHEPTEAFFCGGTDLYATALTLADKLYLTHVHAAVEGDTYFPALDMRPWREVRRDYHPADARHAYAFTMAVYERVPITADLSTEPKS